MDKYKCFLELKKGRPKSFTINQNTQSNSFLIFTPHGGGIEPGTTEICEWFNMNSYSYYSFTGSGINCKELHITSTRFDEPKLKEMLLQHQHAISFHGMTDYMKRKYKVDIFLGGLDNEFMNSLSKKLQTSGFSVATSKEYPTSSLAALKSNNVTNTCKSGRGVQIELSESLRRSFFKGDYRFKKGRVTTTTKFGIFCNLIKESIEASKEKKSL